MDFVENPFRGGRCGNIMDICISFSNEEYDECANGHERQESLSTEQGPPYKDGM